MTPFRWLPEHVAAICPGSVPAAAIFAPESVPDILPGHDVWDHWPVLTEDGALADIAGGTMVIALVAPAARDPNDRHAFARMRLFHRVADDWRDLGQLLPDELTVGSREWSGSALISSSLTQLRLFFTAVGERHEVSPGYQQRLFEVTADVRITGGIPCLENWRQPAESIVPDGYNYEREMAGGNAIGTIKAFRDPFLVKIDGEDWLLFTASKPHAGSRWNGVVGAALSVAGRWMLQPALVTACGLNNELERPHVILHDGRAYLFWSTQAEVFADGGPRGPTGLYGVVSDRWGAPWRPINGTALVFANPAAAPAQAYSFQVLPDLSVWSFADMPGTNDVPRDAAGRRAAFVGGPAPVLLLDLQGDVARIARPCRPPSTALPC